MPPQIFMDFNPIFVLAFFIWICFLFLVALLWIFSLVTQYQHNISGNFPRCWLCMNVNWKSENISCICRRLRFLCRIIVWVCQSLLYNVGFCFELPEFSVGSFLKKYHAPPFHKISAKSNKHNTLDA